MVVTNNEKIYKRDSETLPHMTLKLPRPQRTVYSTCTLDAITASYRGGQPEKVDTAILGNSISHSITKTRDALSALEEMTRDPKTIRRKSTHMARIHAKRGIPLEVQAINEQTESIREDHFGQMNPMFNTLNYDTDRLGAAAELLATCLAYKMSEAGVVDKDLINRVLQFSPRAQYNPAAGKIEFSADGRDYFQLASFSGYKELKQALGRNHLMLPLLELKIAGATLKVPIDSETLRVKVGEYPDDLHSEVMDAVQAVEGNLGYLSKQELPDELSSVVKRAIPSRVTELSQVYVGHRTNPWFARIVGLSGFVTGAAAAVLGGPQTYHWIREGFDPSYTPVLSNKASYELALTLTSAAVSAILYGCLTIGSEIGSRVIRDMRDKLELRKLNEI